MDSTSNPTRVDARQDSGEVLMPAPKPCEKEALSRVLQEVIAIASDRRTDMPSSDHLRATEPSVDATLGSADLRADRLLSDTPSGGRRAWRALFRFVIAAFIGGACILAWQSYGEAAKQKLASWAAQLGWMQLLPGLKPSGAVVQESPPDSAQAASAAQTAPDVAAPNAPAVQEFSPDSAQAASDARTASDVAPIAPAVPSPEVQQQLEAMARDLAALRQSVNQLAVGQEQMTRDIATLKTSALQPKPTAAPARKPVPNPASQAAPKIIAAPALPPPMPPPLQTAPQISPTLPSPGPPLVQPAPEISVAPPGPPPPSRPPMPVPN